MKFPLQFLHVKFENKTKQKISRSLHEFFFCSVFLSLRSRDDAGIGIPQARGFSLDGFPDVVVCTHVGVVTTVDTGSSPEPDSPVVPPSAEAPPAAPAEVLPAGAPSPAQALAAPAEVLPAGAPSPAQVLAAQVASPATGALAPEAATFAVCALCHPCATASGRRPPAATGGLLPAERGGKETEESFY